MALPLFVELFRNQIVNGNTNSFDLDDEKNPNQNGVLRISGVLDGANLILQCLDPVNTDENVEANWSATGQELKINEVLFLKYTSLRYRVKLNNAGASTSVTVILINNQIQ